MSVFRAGLLDRRLSLPLCLFLVGTAAPAQSIWLGGDGDYGEGGNWSGGAAPSSTTNLRIPAGTATLSGSSLSRSAVTEIDGGTLVISGGSFFQGTDAASSLKVSAGRFAFNGPIFSLASRYSTDGIQTGGEIEATVTDAFYFSRSGGLTGRRADYRIEDGVFAVTYAVSSPVPSEFQFMGQNGDDRLVINGGLVRFDGGFRRRMDLQRDARIEINGGAFETDGFSRFSIGRDRRGEALVIVNGGEFRMLESRVDAGGIVLGDYTDGRLEIHGGEVRVTPSSTNASARRSGLIIGRKGKSDTGRANGTLLQTGGVLDLSGLDLTIGDNANGSFGGKGRYVMTGGTLLARNVGTWSGGTFQDDEPGDSYFFFHEGEIVLEGDRRDWPDQAFVWSRSEITREYDPVADRTRLTAVPDNAYPVTHRYFRLAIDRRRGGGSDSREIVQLAEFEFLRDGAKIPMDGVVVSNPGGSNPSGEEPFRIADGNPATKWLDFDRQPLVFTFPAPVTVDAYRFVTANDFPARDPVRWTLEGSDNGVDWTVVDRQATDYPVSKRRFDGSVPFVLPETPVEPFVAEAVRLRYLRFRPSMTRDPGAGVTRLARLEFYRDERRVFPVAIGGLVSDGAAEAIRALVNDGWVRTEWEERATAGGLEFEFGDEVDLDGFLVATGGSDSGADPVRWMMEGSLDGISWFVVDDRLSRPFPTPGSRYTASRVTSFDPESPGGIRFVWSGLEDEVWDTATVNWESDGPAVWRNGAGLEAEFGPAGPKRVEVPGPVEADGLFIREPGYRFSGAGPLVFLGEARMDTSGDLVWTVPLESGSGLRKTGQGEWRLRSGATVSGVVAIQEGSVRMDNGSAWSGGGELRVGSEASSRAELVFAADGDYDFSSASSETRVGLGVDSAGGVLQEAGAVVLGGSGSGYLRLGGSPGSYGFWHLAGGTLDAAGGGRSGVRVGDGGHGVFYQTGGNFSSERWFSVGGDGGAGGESVATFSGGTALINETARVHLAERTDSVGTLNLGSQAGGQARVTIQSDRGITVGLSDAAARATVNLNAGILELYGPLNRLGSGVASVVNADGGTLRAGANQVELAAESLPGIRLHSGGLVVDAAGVDAVFATTLLPAEGAGFYPTGGFLPVASGGSGYVGAPLVRVATSGGGIPPSAIAELEDGSVARLLITAPGENLAVDETLSLTFEGGGPDVPAENFTLPLVSEDLSTDRGGLRKIGSGRLTLAKGIGSVGTARVEEGVLAFGTGTSNDAPLEVGPTGTVTGSFVSTQNLRVAGRLVPGPDDSGVDVRADLVFEPGSALELGIRSEADVPGSGYPEVRADRVLFEGSEENPVVVEVDLSGMSNFVEEGRDYVLLRAQELVGFSADRVELRVTGAPGTGWWRLSSENGDLLLAYRNKPPTDYLSWLDVDDPGTRPSPFEDLNGSGRANLLEYVLGGERNRPGAASGIAIRAGDSEEGSTVRFRRRIGGSEMGRQFLETSRDLVRWDRFELFPHSSPGILIEPVDGEAGMESVTISLDPWDAGEPVFVRLVVQPYPEVLP